jgi:hypothetical protein
MAALLWCEAGCDDEATREVWWIEFPRTVERRGRTAPVCDDGGCLAIVEGRIERDGGDLPGQIDPIRC